VQRELQSKLTLPLADGWEAWGGSPERTPLRRRGHRARDAPPRRTGSATRLIVLSRRNSEHMALQAGRLFGNYRVVRLIGEGAFGEVYLAQNPLIDRRAAVKVLRPMLALDTELVRRFFNEARAASAIRHPSIIEVFDAGGTPEGAPYILMEFLEGKSLKKRLVEVGRCTVAQTLEVASQAGSALAAAHAVGIVHRDLKPENLFLVPDVTAPGSVRVKILDFGIAKVKSSSGSGAGSVRTEAGLIMGSPTYMSPEQCKDSSDVDLRADIYSFATILYEMLAGRPPYVAPTGVELLLMHLSEPPRPLRELAPGVPGHVEDAIMRALRQERSERFDGVPSFLKALLGPGLTPPLPGENLPAVAPKPASNLDRTWAGQAAASTFSQANAQVISESGIRTHVVPRSFGRWFGLACGGLVGLGLLSFFHFRRGHDMLPPVAREATVTPPNVVAGVIEGVTTPVRALAPKKILLADPPRAADSEPRPAVPVAAAQTQDAGNHAANTDAKSTVAKETARHHHAAERAQATMVKGDARVPKRRSGAPLTPTQPDQEDIAGF
jgi:serine/threonine protein kinase